MILGGNILFCPSWSVFLCDLSLLIIIRFNRLGFPIRLPFFPALCLRLAYVAVLIIGGESLGFIGRKPPAILIVLGDGILFCGSAKVIRFISRGGFGPVLPPDGSGFLRQGIPLRIGYILCNCLA